MTQRQMNLSYKTISSRPSVSGFSLVELMIALVLGLIIIGAIITVFVSNQASYRTKVAFDNAQEAFRFSSHTINRVVRAASQVDPASDTETLVLQITGVDNLIRDCSGVHVPDGETITNTFSVSGNQLQCETANTNPDAPDGPITLVGGIGSIGFAFGVGPPGAYIQDYSEAGTFSDWGNVRAVRTTIEMDEAAATISVEFTSALRGNLVPEILVIRPGG